MDWKFVISIFLWSFLVATGTLGFGLRLELDWIGHCIHGPDFLYFQFTLPLWNRLL